MMIKQIFCDRCGKVIKEITDGYSVSLLEINEIGLIVNLTRGCMPHRKHLCGKQCLILALNEIIDELANIKPVFQTKEGVAGDHI